MNPVLLDLLRRRVLSEGEDTAGLLPHVVALVVVATALPQREGTGLRERLFAGARTHLLCYLAGSTDDWESARICYVVSARESRGDAEEIARRASLLAGGVTPRDTARPIRLLASLVAHAGIDVDDAIVQAIAAAANRTDPRDPSKARDRLLLLMKAESEGRWSAGWHLGTEQHLYRLMLSGELPKIAAASQAAGGWFVWDDAVGAPRFVEKERWLAMWRGAEGVIGSGC